jgi:hypothetical protein
MSVTFFGQTFAINDQWGRQEHALIDSVCQQVIVAFPEDNNVVINLTWFGPQFNNSAWYKVQEVIKTGKKFDRIFWLSSVDPICLSPDQFEQIEKDLSVTGVYRLGGFDQSPGNFCFSAWATSEDFVRYQESDISIQEIKYVYVCYNRKPKPHRINLVEALYQNKLESHGIITLGKNDATYDVSQGIKTNLYLKLDDPVENYSHNGKFAVPTNFGGVPYDLCSLGRLDIWQSHFLNVVSETEFLPWDNMFVTEKTWKPIIGMRPFVINGQTTIYQWLRDNGFRTFNHYWPHIEIENVTEIEVHESIVAVLKFLSTMDNARLLDMYYSMLPDLLHNKNRFFEFATEQKNKIDKLFC